MDANEHFFIGSSRSRRSSLFIPVGLKRLASVPHVTVFFPFFRVDSIFHKRG